jgi:hypothetical protein
MHRDLLTFRFPAPVPTSLCRNIRQVALRGRRAPIREALTRCRGGQAIGDILTARMVEGVTQYEELRVPITFIFHLARDESRQFAVSVQLNLSCRPLQ